jgi:hypothetical protein
MDNEVIFDPGENWFSNDKLLKTVLDKKFDKTTPLLFLEIGSWKGRSALWFLENYLIHPDSKLYCVDTWNMHEWNDYNQEKAELSKNKGRAEELQIDHIYDQFIFNLTYKNLIHKCVPIKKRSVEALNEFKDNFFDFIFVDGDHSERGCYQDLRAAWPKVKEGGILFGDDWAWSENGTNKPVQLAANRFAKENNLRIRPWFGKGNGYYFKKCLNKR